MRRRAALMGNPNVGKSTIFNGLTGLRQHTGNWAGVTVSCAAGEFSLDGHDFSLADLPGLYSFNVRTAEEAAARDFIVHEDFDDLILVADATCLERGLHLLSQASGILLGRTAQQKADEGESAAPGFASLSTPAALPSPAPSPSCPRLLLCVNLCDEAEKKGIRIDFSLLQKSLGIPVIPCCGRTKKGLAALKEALAREETDILAETSVPGETAVSHLPLPFSPADLAAQAVSFENPHYRRLDERLDRLVTGPVSGKLLMLLLLMGVFWLTITGANFPSSLLWDFFFSMETKLLAAAAAANLPGWLIGAGIHGVYRAVAWIVSVMLPPMAIFFPLFTLLEDFGYLPRAAFNMDRAFHRCKACGKQCLTMTMGLGCNAAGVVGCRIIDSPRERLIAILTNSLVPCNGRFPLLITMISLFFLGSSAGLFRSAAGAAALTILLLMGVFATLASSWLLSHTLLKGVSSSFTLELPPYRRPQIRQVIVRSVFDRTIFVLGRAVAVAAPAGLLIWLMANVTVNAGEPGLQTAQVSLLSLAAGFFDPLGRLMGLDGVILLAFLLAFPANEIVLPIILMAYLQSGTLVNISDETALLGLLTAHGWTVKTAVCMAVFTLFHWPCSTTCLTIKKETGSFKWAAVAALLPTAIGFSLCTLINLVF